MDALSFLLLSPSFFSKDYCGRTFLWVRGVKLAAHSRMHHAQTMPSPVKGEHVATYHMMAVWLCKFDIHALADYRHLFSPFFFSLSHLVDDAVFWLLFFLALVALVVINIFKGLCRADSWKNKTNLCLSLISFASEPLKLLVWIADYTFSILMSPRHTPAAPSLNNSFLH